MWYRSSSGCLSVWQQFTSISYTIDARITKLTYMHDAPMHTDGGNVFEIFLRLSIL